VKFASCEDVIIHKMIAGRAIDLEDIKNILIKNKSSVDKKYIIQWLSQFSVMGEYKQVVQKFERLLKTID
jgi:hypothetical protein